MGGRSCEGWIMLGLWAWGGDLAFIAFSLSTDIASDLGSEGWTISEDVISAR